MNEMLMVEEFQRTLDEKSDGKLDHRFVLAVHDQDGAVESQQKTATLCRITDRAVLWNLAHDKSKAKDSSLFDKTHDGYETIVNTCSDDKFWRNTLLDLSTHPPEFRLDNSLARIEGVSAFKGTCVGFGSTVSAATGACMHCGDQTGHAITDPTAFDTKEEWKEEADAMIVGLMTNPTIDRVAAIEQVANMLKRGANETRVRFEELSKLLKDEGVETGPF